MNSVAPSPDPQYQARQDDDHLRLLSIVYYGVAGLVACSGLVFLFNILIGLGIASSGFAPPSGTITVNPNTFPGAPVTPPDSIPIHAAPPTFGWLFVGMGVFALVSSTILSALTFSAGHALSQRRSKTLIQVVAALLCLSVPIGTLLGVFTFIVLSRPRVALLFDSHPQS